MFVPLATFNCRQRFVARANLIFVICDINSLPINVKTTFDRFVACRMFLSDSMRDEILFAVRRIIYMCYDRLRCVIFPSIFVVSHSTHSMGDLCAMPNTRQDFAIGISSD